MTYPKPVMNDGKKPIAEYDVIDFGKKIHEEAAEFHEAMLLYEFDESGPARSHFVEEGVDVIASVMTALNAFGITQKEIEEAVKFVNEKNYRRGYFE